MGPDHGIMFSGRLKPSWFVGERTAFLGDWVRLMERATIVTQRPSSSLVVSLISKNSSVAEVQRLSQQIHDLMLQGPASLGSSNFRAIGPADLWRMYQHYDRLFFEGTLSAAVLEACRGALSFRVSERMTSAAGKTTRTRRELKDGSVHLDFEIAISALLLFETFRDEERTILVCGIRCEDRLQALQRIFEHELIHLIEMLVWGESNCSKPNFHHLARGHFGHLAAHHALVTPRERAATEHAIHIGDRVGFEFEGAYHVGIVNRITRRVTVLVEHPRGSPYTDGKRYMKFYVPMRELVKV